MKKISRPILRSAAIGAIAGMRTFSAPAWTASALNTKAKRPFLGMALFETIADKMPWIGRRTHWSQLAGRIASGGTSAYFDSRKTRSVRKRIALSLIGAASALGATFGAFHARRWLGRKLRLPDPVIGGAEDVLASSVGMRLVGKPRRK